MARLFRGAVIAAVLLMSATAAYAEDPTVTILDVDDSGFPQVRAIVTVAEAGGRPVTDLSAQSFQALETDAQATVTGVEAAVDEQVEVGVILTVDTSGSMLQLDAMTQAKAAATAFVRDLKPVDQTAVVSFANQVTVVSPLTPDRNAALAAIGGLQAVGNTALYSGVADSINLARQAPLRRRAIILLSDGVDSGGVSAATREQSLALASEARIPIYIIGLGDQIDRTYLQELAQRSGGAFLETPGPGGISGLYQQLSQLLRSQYVVTLTSTASADVEGRSLQLRVNASSGSAETRFDYQTKRTILPPAAAVVESEGSSNLALYLMLVLILVVGIGATGRYAYGRQRDRRLSREIAALSERARVEAPSLAPAMPARPTTPLQLVVHAPDGVKRYPIGLEPATIGTSPSCQLRLEAPPDTVAAEHARVWNRDGKLMFHHVARGYTSTIGGEPVTWVSLDRGDEVQIGPYRLSPEPA